MIGYVDMDLSTKNTAPLIGKVMEILRREGRLEIRRQDPEHQWQGH